MEPVKQDQNTNKEIKKPINLTPTIEERLRIIANIIIDRVIEDQQNGKLRFKSQPAK